VESSGSLRGKQQHRRRRRQQRVRTRGKPVVLGVRNVTVRPVADATAATRATPAGARKARANNIAIPQQQQQQQQQRQTAATTTTRRQQTKCVDLRKSTGYPTKAAPKKPWPPLPRASPTSSPTPTTLAPEAATLATPATRTTNAAAIATRQARPPTNDKDAVPRIHGARLVARSNAWAFGHPSNARPKPPLSQPPSTPASHSSLSACALSLHRTAHTRSLARSAACVCHRRRALSLSRALSSPSPRALPLPYARCLLAPVGRLVCSTLSRAPSNDETRPARSLRSSVQAAANSLLSLPQRGGSTVANGCSTTVSATQLQRTSSLSLSSPSLSARVCGCLLCNRWVGRLSAGVDTRLSRVGEIYITCSPRERSTTLAPCDAVCVHDLPCRLRQLSWFSAIDASLVAAISTPHDSLSLSLSPSPPSVRELEDAPAHAPAHTCCGFDFGVNPVAHIRFSLLALSVSTAVCV